MWIQRCVLTLIPDHFKRRELNASKPFHLIIKTYTPRAAWLNSMHCSVAITYFNTAMRLSLLSFHVFSLKHKARWDHDVQQSISEQYISAFFSCHALGKTQLSVNETLKSIAFWFRVFPFILSQVSTFWLLLETAVRRAGRRLSCSPWPMKDGQF